MRLPYWSRHHSPTISLRWARPASEICVQLRSRICSEVIPARWARPASVTLAKGEAQTLQLSQIPQRDQTRIGDLGRDQIQVPSDPATPRDAPCVRVCSHWQHEAGNTVCVQFADEPVPVVHRGRGQHPPDPTGGNPHRSIAGRMANVFLRSGRDDGGIQIRKMGESLLNIDVECHIGAENSVAE